jgi:hypothetical protein
MYWVPLVCPLVAGVFRYFTPCCLRPVNLRKTHFYCSWSHVVEVKTVEGVYMYFDEFNRAIKRAGELKGIALGVTFFTSVFPKGKADMILKASNSENSIIMMEVTALKEQVASLTEQENFFSLIFSFSIALVFVELSSSSVTFGNNLVC